MYGLTNTKWSISIELVELIYTNLPAKLIKGAHLNLLQAVQTKDLGKSTLLEVLRSLNLFSSSLYLVFTASLDTLLYEGLCLGKLSSTMY